MAYPGSDLIHFVQLWGDGYHTTEQTFARPVFMCQYPIFYSRDGGVARKPDNYNARMTACILCCEYKSSHIPEEHLFDQVQTVICRVLVA